MEKLGFSPRTFHMTTELHPLLPSTPLVIYYYHCRNSYELFTHVSQCWLLVVIVIFKQHIRLVIEGMEKLGFECRSFHMQSERSTTDLHPLLPSTPFVIYYCHSHNSYELFTKILQCWGYSSLLLFFSSTPDLF